MDRPIEGLLLEADANHARRGERGVGGGLKGEDREQEEDEDRERSDQSFHFRKFFFGDSSVFEEWGVWEVLYKAGGGARDLGGFFFCLVFFFFFNLFLMLGFGMRTRILFG